MSQLHSRWLYVFANMLTYSVKKNYSHTRVNSIGIKYTDKWSMCFRQFELITVFYLNISSLTCISNFITVNWRLKEIYSIGALCRTNNANMQHYLKNKMKRAAVRISMVSLHQYNQCTQNLYIDTLKFKKKKWNIHQRCMYDFFSM